MLLVSAGYISIGISILKRTKMPHDIYVLGKFTA